MNIKKDIHIDSVLNRNLTSLPLAVTRWPCTCHSDHVVEDGFKNVSL